MLLCVLKSLFFQSIKFFQIIIWQPGCCLQEHTKNPAAVARPPSPSPPRSGPAPRAPGASHPKRRSAPPPPSPVAAPRRRKLSAFNFYHHKNSFTHAHMQSKFFPHITTIWHFHNIEQINYMYNISLIIIKHQIFNLTKFFNNLLIDSQK